MLLSMIVFVVMVDLLLVLVGMNVSWLLVILYCLCVNVVVYVLVGMVVNL